MPSTAIPAVDAQASSTQPRVEQTALVERSRRRGMPLLVLGFTGVLIIPLLEFLAPHYVESCPYMAAGNDGGKKHAVTEEQLTAYDHSTHMPRMPPASKSPNDIDGTAGADLPVFTEKELMRYDGSPGAPGLLIAVGGRVYDVSRNGGSSFYGPGGSYAAFAGRACTRGVALPSLDESDIHDDVGDFDEPQRARLRHWLAFFQRKYPQVGVLKRGSSAERKALDAARESRKAKARAAKEALIAANAARGTGRAFTLAELREYDDTDPRKPVLLAVGGHVLDVSSSKNLYGKKAPRHMFAGRAITRAVTLQSTKTDDLNDRTDDFDEEQREVMAKRVQFFLSRYKKVGVLAR